MQTNRPLSPIGRDALRIWQAGLDAVRADFVVRSRVEVDGDELIVDDEPYDLAPDGKLIVVGAGKATHGMACGLAQAFHRSNRVLDVNDPGSLFFPKQLDVEGWINIPAGTDERSLDPRIVAYPARPKGKNEPTEECRYGTQRIIELVQNAGPEDTVVCLISGGGSALLVSPKPGISLEDKKWVARYLSSQGASIEELNSVRRVISQVKGGGLLKGCRARQVITLIISDVLGDPIELIASGPTVPNITMFDKKSGPLLALEVLDRYDPQRSQIPPSVYRVILEAFEQEASDGIRRGERYGEILPSKVTHHVLANNATAVDAAGTEAVSLGYTYWMDSARSSEGPAEEVGQRLARQAFQSRDRSVVECLISGGEPTVVLADESIRGIGGRNTHLALAALEEWIRLNQSAEASSDVVASDISATNRSVGVLRELAFVSGGTDGEDGPTTSAGAWWDLDTVGQLSNRTSWIQESLNRCDSHTFFKEQGGLIETGPTHTNVCDLRVVLMR